MLNWETKEVKHKPTYEEVAEFDDFVLTVSDCGGDWGFNLVAVDGDDFIGGGYFDSKEKAQLAAEHMAHQFAMLREK